MRSLLFVGIFLCLFLYVESGGLQIFLKDKLPKQRIQNLLKGVFCKPKVKKSFVKDLLCNKTGLDDQCKDTSTSFYYASSRENVSRAIRTASSLYPNFKTVVLASKDITYQMLQCYRDAFIDIQESIQNGEHTTDEFWEEWEKACPEYRNITLNIVKSMNETQFPPNELFYYTYPNLTTVVNSSMTRFMEFMRNMYNETVWNQENVVAYYLPYLMGCRYLIAYRNDDNTTLAAVSKFFNPLLKYEYNVTVDGVTTTQNYVGAEVGKAQEYCFFIDKWSRFNSYPVGDREHRDMSDDDYQKLIALNLYFEKYLHANVAHFYNEMVARFVDGQVADDTSDPTVNHVAEVVGDFMGNGTGDDSQSGTINGTGSGPTDEYVKKYCDFINDPTKQWPWVPFTGRPAPSGTEKIAKQYEEKKAKEKKDKKNNTGTNKIQDAIDKLKDTINNKVNNNNNNNNAVQSAADKIKEALAKLKGK